MGRGSAGLKRLVSLAWGKKELVGRWTHPKHEKTPGPSHTQANIAPGEQRNVPLFTWWGTGWCNHLTMWPQQPHDPWPHGPHTWAPGGGLKQTAARNKLRYLDDYWAAACGLLKIAFYVGAGTLNTAFCLGLAEEMGFETRVRSCPRMCSTCIKPLSFWTNVWLMNFTFVVTGSWTPLFVW